MFALDASAVSTSVIALRVRLRRRDPLLGLGDAARRDELHRLGDLLRRPGRCGSADEGRVPGQPCDAYFFGGRRRG